MRAVGLFLLILPLSGCLYHEARVQAVAPPGCELTAGRSAVLGRVADGAPAEFRRGPLPQDIPASWWLRDGQGRLLVAQVRATSPLPWWQRFPCDLAVDLWPGEVVIATTVTAVPTPFRSRSPDEITAEARAHGYAP